MVCTSSDTPQAERPVPLEFTGAATGDPMTVTVPANYGYVFIPE
jgi:hypothetical protein